MTVNEPERLPSGLWLPANASAPGATPVPAASVPGASVPATDPPVGSTPAATGGGFAAVPQQVEQLGHDVSALLPRATEIRRLVSPQLPADAFGQTPGSREAARAMAERAQAADDDMTAAVIQLDDLGHALRVSAHTYRHDDATSASDFGALGSKLPPT